MKRQEPITRILAGAVLLLVAGHASAALLLYEPFNYAAGQGLAGQAGQTVVAGTTGGPSGTGQFWGQQAPNGNYWMSCGLAAGTAYSAASDLLISDTSLSVSGLAQSSGGSVTYGGQGMTARMAFSPVYAAGDGSPVNVYYSFAFMIPSGGLSGTSANGGLIGGFNNTRGSQTGNPSTVGAAFHAKASGSGFVVGINEDSAASLAATYDLNNVLNFDTTYFVVGKYTIQGSTAAGAQDDTMRMWVNPASSTFGGVDPTQTPIIALAPQNDVPPLAADGNAIIQTFILRQDGTSTAGNAATTIYVDELRIGTTYADVTPVPEPTALSLLALGVAMLLPRRFGR